MSPRFPSRHLARRALVVLALSLGSHAAWASPAREEKARALFREGVSLQDGGDAASALEKYEAAYALWKNPKILANVGSAYGALGRPLDAARAYDAFLDATPPGGEARQRAETALATALRQIGTLSIAANEELATVTVDGVKITEHPERVRVLPGSHVVKARTRDGRTTARRANVRAGETEAVLLEFAADTADDEPEAPPPPAIVEADGRPEAASSSALPWVLGGIGVGGLVASGAFFAVRQGATSDLQGSCVDGICPGDEQSTIDRANTFGVLSAVALGVGAAGVGAAVVLLAIGGSGPEEPPAPQAAFAVGVGPAGTLGAAASGRF